MESMHKERIQPMYRNIEEFVGETLKRSLGCRAGVVAAADPHIMEAVVAAKKDGVIKPTLIGEEEKIRKVVADYGEPAEDYVIVNAGSNEEAVSKAIELVKAGELDIMVKGLIDTATLMKQMVKGETGIRKGLVSVCGVFEFPKYHKLLGMTDMGINMFPDVDQKRKIIENAVGLMHKIGIEEPKIAVLSSVEKVNPKQPDTVDAAALKEMNEKGEIKGCIVEGPISLDLALQKESAAIKGYTSPVAGDADVLVFPDIVVGNIAGKGMGLFGDAQSMDVVLGLEVPLVFGSRGGPAKGKYNSMCLAARLADTAK